MEGLNVIIDSLSLEDDLGLLITQHDNDVARMVNEESDFPLQQVVYDKGCEGRNMHYSDISDAEDNSKQGGNELNFE